VSWPSNSELRVRFKEARRIGMETKPVEIGGRSFRVKMEQAGGGEPAEPAKN
jgi:hypothetical protein